MSVSERAKEIIREASQHLETAVDTIAQGVSKASELVSQTHEDIGEGLNRLNDEIQRRIYNAEWKDIDGKLLYVVHFVEYIEGKKQTDIPVFYGTTPEWAVGFCKAHTDYASKFENDKNRWWYFYINEAALNDKLGGRGWIATLDWNGSITKDTFHFDKGYGVDYQKEKVMLSEQDPCDACKINEVDEAERDKQKTELALAKAIIVAQVTAPSWKVTTKQEGDWWKLIIESPDFEDNFIDYALYERLFNEFGVGAGNSILIYFQKSK